MTTVLTTATLSLAPGPALAIGAVLLLVAGAFVAVEVALLALPGDAVGRAAEAGDRRAALASRQLRERPVTFAAAQLGITACALGLGAVAVPATAAAVAPVTAAVPWGSTVADTVALVVALASVTLAHVVVAELASKHLAVAHAERVVAVLSRPLAWFVAVLRPVVVALHVTARAVVRIVRVEPVDEEQLVHSPEELAMAVAESHDLGAITAQDAQVIGAALRLAEIDAAAAMTPRVDLVAVAEDATAEEVLQVAADSGHTRLPVYRDDVDHVLGVLHVKRLLTGTDPTVTVADAVRPLPAVPATRDLESLMAQMLRDGEHALLVVDEYGGTAGLLTLEDVLEELVGDIEDEFDADEGVRLQADRVWVVPGTLRRDELERSTGLAVEAVDADTVSGWMTEQLGRLVRPGDRVDTDQGWTLTVLDLEGRRAGDVEVRAPRDG